MIALAMVYCLSGEPCATETLAIFPQPDIGAALCEIARPAIAEAIRQKDRSGATATFSCSMGAMPVVPEYQPLRREDERYRMIDAGEGSAVDKVLDIINRMAR